MLFAFLGVSNVAWATETTISVGSSSLTWTADGNDYKATSGDFNLRYEKGTYTNSISGGIQSAELRLYSGTNFVISSTNTITKIVYNVADGSGKNYSVSALSTADGNLSNGTWTGSATSVTASLSAQNRIKSVTITYTSSGGGDPTPTTYTVTYEANEGTGTMTDSNSPYNAGATVTVKDNEFTRDGYTFSNWNTAANGSGTNYDEGDTFTINANTTLYAQWTANGGGSTADVTYDFTSTNNFWTDNPGTTHPTAGTSYGTYYYTNGDEFSASGSDYRFNASGYFILGKSGAYLQLPTFDFDVEKIVVTGKTGASGSVVQNIFVGDQAVSTATTGATGTNTYVIADGYEDAGNVFTLKVTSSHNTQITKIEVFAKAASAPSFTISNNDEIAYDATSGSFDFTVKHEVTGGVTSVSENVDWISDAAVSGNSVTFTTIANNTASPRNGVITLTYSYNTNETVTKEVTVTQAGNVSQVTFLFSEDYGQTFINNNTYATSEFEYTGKAVTLYVEGCYRFWNNDKTLRLYYDHEDLGNAQMMLTAPAGNVITRVEFGVTATALVPDYGSISGSTWTGAANSVLFTHNGTSGSVNIATMTVHFATSFTQEVSSNGWATFVVPDVPVTFAEGDAYVVSSVNATSATLSGVTSVPARTPVLLKGAGTKNISLATSTPSAPTNLLSISDGTAPDTGSYNWVLAKDGEGACFKQWTGDADALTGKVVLVLNFAAPSTNARLQFVFDDEATGVNAVNGEGFMVNGPVFDLQGRRVAQPQKGLYIVNGRKVVVK